MSGQRRVAHSSSFPSHRGGLRYLQPVLPLQQLVVQQLSGSDGGAQLPLQIVRTLSTEHRVQQVSFHLQQTQTLLQLGAVLQETLKETEEETEMMQLEVRHWNAGSNFELKLISNWTTIKQSSCTENIKTFLLYKLNTWRILSIMLQFSSDSAVKLSESECFWLLLFTFHHFNLHFMTKINEILAFY